MRTTIIDLSYLKTIGGNDSVFIKEMLVMVKNSVPKEIENIQHFFNNGNYLMMASTAHKIKAPLQMITGNDIIDVLTSIETIGKNAIDVKDVPNLIDKLNELYNIIEEEIIAVEKEII
jgi:HPt (histidine-containing phosphotransfer) domain-containing protein